MTCKARKFTRTISLPVIAIAIDRDRIPHAAATVLTNADIAESQGGELWIR